MNQKNTIFFVYKVFFFRNLSGGAKCAIAKDYIKGVLMNTVDEVLDIFSVVSAFIGSSSGSV